MYYRRKIILALLQRFAGALPHTDFQKYLFLFNQLREEPVYEFVPYYAINSEIASLHLNANELASIDRSRPSPTGTCLFTIGYEGSSIERYMNLLIQNGVALLCDVRRNPISMKHGFSKKQLHDIAQKLGIDYVHIPELGIESSKRKSLKTADNYAVLFEEYEREYLPAHITSLEHIHDLVKNRERVAITCFEREYIYCHRHKVANALQHLPGWNIPVTHL